MQIINKKCPHCVAIFKVKSALESHLQTKHPDKQPINVDQIPDVKPHDDPLFTNGDIWSSGSCFYGTNTIDSGVEPSYGIGGHSTSGGSMPHNFLDSHRSINAPPPMGHLGGGDPIAQHTQFRWTDGKTHEANTMADVHDAYEASESDEISYSADDSNTDHDEIFDRNAPDGYDRSHHLNYYPIGGGPLTGCRTTNGMFVDPQIERPSKNCGTFNGSDGHGDMNRSGQKKRQRTPMNNKQLKTLRMLFDAFKTPNMIDCELVGREIGLPKRVVQVGCCNSSVLFC